MEYFNPSRNVSNKFIGHFSHHNHRKRSIERMINVLSFRQRHEPENRLSLPWNPFLRLQATPLRRVDDTSTERLDTIVKKASQPLRWVDPSPSLLRHYESNPPLKSPEIDLCLPLETTDQWVLSGFDDSFDNSKRLSPYFKSELESWNDDKLSSQRFSVQNLSLCKIEDSDIEYFSSTRKRKRCECPSSLIVEDIRAIFDAMKRNSTPSSHLNFQIVLSTKGQKISPPSYAFESRFTRKTNHCLNYILLTFSYRWPIRFIETFQEEERSCRHS
jgi:hypothetical protein